MNRPVLALMGSSLLWGCAWMPLKALGQAGLDGLVLVLCTFSLLTLATLPMAWKHSGGASAAGPLLLIALLGGGANLAFTLAMVYGEVVRSMALFYLLPLWGVLGGRLILGEPIDGLRWLGVALALCGAWLILGGVDILHTLPSGFELFGLLAGFLLAMNNLVFRGVAQLPLSPKLAAMFAGCAALAGLGLIGTDQSWPTNIAPLAWGGVLLYAFVWLLPANLGAQYGVTHLEAGRASVILILELVAAVVSATLIGDEWMTPLEWTGAGLILSAALIEALRSESRSTPDPVTRSDAL